MNAEIRKYRKKIEVLMAVVLLVSVTIFAIKPRRFLSQRKVGVSEETTIKMERETNGCCVVIDPGHGGKDPGKVGTKGMLEKEVNLKISFQLKSILEEKGYMVRMTRSQDCHLGTERFRKTADLNERCRMINNCFEENIKTVMISIHQNSFEKPSVAGAQCFYYHKSQQGKELAEAIQKRLNEKINTSGEKKEKSNDNYYMLINSQCPGIIIECGFLSNPEEEEKLGAEDYQSFLSRVIAEGIEDYFRQKGHCS